MDIMFSIIIPVMFFFGLGVAFRSIVSGTAKRESREAKKALAEDREANFSRSVAVPNEKFFTPNLDYLNIKDYPNIQEDIVLSRLFESLERSANKKMIRLSPPMTNFEIKKTYGVVNLDLITTCEGNYYNYIHGLNNFAEALIKREQYDKAEAILKHCIVDAQSNVSKSFKLIMSLYEGKKDRTGLSDILLYVIKLDTLKHDADLKERILAEAGVIA